MERNEGPGFFAWWFGQLRDLLGVRRKPVERRLDRALIFRPDGHRFEIARLRKGAASTIGWITLGEGRTSAIKFSDAEGGRSRLEQVLRRNRDPVVLRLPEGLGMFIDETLPFADSRDLPALLQHRIDLISPWTHDQVYFDHMVKSYPDPSHVSARIAIAPKTVIDTLIARLHGHAISVDAVDLEGDVRWSPPVLDLLQKGKVRRVGGSRWFPATIAVLLCAGIFAYNALAYREAYRTHAEAASYRSALEGRLADMPQIEQDLNALRERTSFIGLAKADSPSSMVVIENLSRILPQNAWLDRIVIDGVQVEISGLAATSTEIPALLEASQHFTDVDFQTTGERLSVTVQGDQSMEYEPFTISATILPRWRPVE